MSAKTFVKKLMKVFLYLFLFLVYLSLVAGLAYVLVNHVFPLF
ncbi:MAG: hypothetical protein V1645_02000 [archaeon]